MTLAKIRSKLYILLLTLVLQPRNRHGFVRLGSSYGGWWVPVGALRPGAVAYCAGVGEDISFDLELHARGIVVTSFDPTPRSAVLIKKMAPQGDRFKFVPVGWWNEEKIVKFYAPQDPTHVSHSIVNLQRTTEFFEAEVKPVSQLMGELGDKTVDIIKMDIEGAEYAVIDSLLRDGPLASTLCLEFDQPEPLTKTLRAVRKLRASGYHLNIIEGWNYTFTRRAGLNEY